MLFDEHLPSGLGIKPFGREHLYWLLASVLICVFLCLLYRRLGAPGARVLELFIGGLILGLEILRLAVQIGFGVFGIYYLPLHLCGIASYLAFIDSVTKHKSRLMEEFLYCLCMPGAVFALIFPDWVRYPVLNLMSLQSFIIHILIASYPIMRVSSGRMKPNARQLPKCFALLVSISVVIYIFNKAANVNFFFLNWPSPDSPLGFFEDLFGNPGYILGYLPIIAAVWILLYLPFEIKRRINWRKSGTIR